MPGSGTDKTKPWTDIAGPIVVLVEPQLGQNIGTVARAMAACTSCCATSIDSASENSSVTTDPPPEETEVICARAGICPNCRSSGVVTAEAMVSALAPGRVVATTMVG